MERKRHSGTYSILNGGMVGGRGQRKSSGPSAEEGRPECH